MNETTKEIPTLPLSNLLKSLTNKYWALSKAPARYPDIFRFRVLSRIVHVVHRPDLAQQVLQRSFQNFPKDDAYEVLALLLGNGLVTNTDSNNWRKQRTLLQPSFHRHSLAEMCRITVDSTRQLLKEWKSKEGQEINFTQEMARLTIDIVSKTLFTSDITQQQMQMVWRNINFMNAVAARRTSNPLRLPWHYPMPHHIRGRKYIRQLDELIYGIINKRKQQTNPPHDLLQVLIEARYEDGSSMSDEQIRDEVMTVFVAGHETTVNALSWTWYLLKLHPDCERLLREESAPYRDKELGFESVAELKYGACVMNEAMRLYPPVPAVGRQAVQDEEIGGYLLKAGSITVVSIGGLHHHPDYWPEPFAFRPDRFADFDTKGNNRYLFMPFGGGPRICIGNHFAMLEMQLINAMISAHVDMDLLSRDVKPRAFITLKPDGGIRMRLRKIAL
jgi:cytochrome P450